MGFVSYPHLILLISDQIFEVTVSHKKFWELNGPERESERERERCSMVPRAMARVRPALAMVGLSTRSPSPHASFVPTRPPNPTTPSIDLSACMPSYHQSIELSSSYPLSHLQDQLTCMPIVLKLKVLVVACLVWLVVTIP